MRTKIIASAMSWIETPYHHHARIKGVGIDCAQLIVGVALECELLTLAQATAIPSYSVQWHLHNKEEKMIEQLEFCGCVDTKNTTPYATPGDIITFKFGRTSSHLGICVSPTRFIHADLAAGKVVCVSMNDEWVQRWTHTFLFPGLTNG